MAIRLPLTTVVSKTQADETGVNSVAGGVQIPFVIPQDTDNVVVKFTTSVAGAYSAVFQTTDDGGTTYYDVARTSIVSNANNTTAEWLSIPVEGVGFRSQVVAQTSVSAATNTAIALNTIGAAAASTIGGAQQTGLPLLSQQARLFIRITGNVTSAASNTYTAQVKVNSQSATA